MNKKVIWTKGHKIKDFFVFPRGERRDDYVNMLGQIQFVKYYEDVIDPSIHVEISIVDPLGIINSAPVRSGSEELLKLHRNNRKRVYVSKLGLVANYNKEDIPAEFSIVNFMRVNNIVKYSKKHLESTKGIFEKYTPRQLWSANNRLNLEGYGEEEWNYMTVDGYYSKEDAMKSQNVPQKELSLIHISEPTRPY